MTSRSDSAASRNVRSPAVDQYIAQARPFAQPILIHLRDAVHHAVPDVEEQMKWSRPFFVYRGVILGNISSFNEHCSFGLWGGEMAQTLRAGGIDSREAMGSFGRITSVADLPSRSELEGYIRHAAGLIGSGTRTRSIERVAKPSRAEVAVPDALATALRSNGAAAEHFARMSSSGRREYAEWIDSAKREDTRARRVATAIEWIAEGKGRNWKYESGS